MKLLGAALVLFGVALAGLSIWGCIGGAVSAAFGGEGGCYGTAILVGLAMVGAGALVYGGLPWN